MLTEPDWIWRENRSLVECRSRNEYATPFRDDEVVFQHAAGKGRDSRLPPRTSAIFGAYCAS